MQQERINYFAVGLFVLVLVGGFIYTLMQFTGRTGAQDMYYTRFDEVNGLKKGSAVEYMGYKVGHVAAIEPVPADGRLSFKVRLALNKELREWKVPADSVARLQASSLLSGVSIDIRAGTDGAVWAPGSEIAGQGRVDLVSAVSDTANTIRRLTEHNIVPLLTQVGAVVNKAATAVDDNAAPLLSSLNRLATQLEAQGPQTLSSVAGAADEIARASRGLTSLVGGERTARIDEVIENVLRTSEDLRHLGEETRANVGGLLGPETATRVQVLGDNLNAAAVSFRELADNTNATMGTVLNEDTAKRLASALGAFATAANNVSRLSAELRRTRAKVDGILDGLDRVIAVSGPEVQAATGDLRFVLDTIARDIATITQNLEDSSHNFNEFSRAIRRNPGVLLRGQSTNDASFSDR